MMLVIMDAQARMRETSAVIARLEDLGYHVHLSEGNNQTVLGIVGSGQPLDFAVLEQMPGVARVVPVRKPFKLASRDFKAEDTRFPIANQVVGGQGLIIMAGPCSVESRSQILETAHAVKEAGAHVLRGGAFKPRSSPTLFRGWAKRG